MKKLVLFLLGSVLVFSSGQYMSATVVDEFYCVDADDYVIEEAEDFEKPKATMSDEEMNALINGIYQSGDYISFDSGEVLEENMAFPQGGFDVDYSFSNLSPGIAKHTGGKLVVISGVTTVRMSLTWTPRTETMKAGFYNINTRKMYLTDFNSPGIKNLGTSTIPDGSYEIVIAAAPTNTNAISGKIEATFE